jgi:hypothetical protein
VLAWQLEQAMQEQQKNKTGKRVIIRVADVKAK